MQRIMLKGKIHRATVTQTEIEYNGSITIDMDLVDAAGMLPYEMVQVYDLDNGARLETYIIPGKRGSRCVCMNGAAARLIHKGDKVIIVNFVILEEGEAGKVQPTIIELDNDNNIIKR